MGLQINNGMYGFSSLIDNIKEAARGSKIVSGFNVLASGSSFEVVVYSGTGYVSGTYFDHNMSGVVIDSGTSGTAAGSELLSGCARYDLITVGSGGIIHYASGTAAKTGPLPPNLPPHEVALALIKVESGTGAWQITQAEITDYRIIETDSSVPIGTILPWAKSLGGVPNNIPFGWIECDGSTISDPQSPLDGTTVPDMAGNNYFLRGNSTSGGTGGSTSTDAFGDNRQIGGGAVSAAGANHAHTGNEPPYYDVVMILKYR